MFGEITGQWFRNSEKDSTYDSSTTISIIWLYANNHPVHKQSSWWSFHNYLFIFKIGNCDSQGHDYKTSFLLMLGYAIIGHKSQGATISSKVMIHICESFAWGLVYVMLSRVTSWKILKIVNNFQPLNIQPMLPWFFENKNIVVKWNTNTCIILI